MPNTTLQLPVPAPLTTFAEDEILFRDNIRQFAEDKVRPLVKEMDEKGVFDHDLIQQFFQLGLRGRGAITFSTAASCGSQTRRKPASSFSLPPSIPQRDTGG